MISALRYIYIYISDLIFLVFFIHGNHTRDKNLCHLDIILLTAHFVPLNLDEFYLASHSKLLGNLFITELNQAYVYVYFPYTVVCTSQGVTNIWNNISLTRYNFHWLYW